ncbi:NAD(P)/FAD-dependent oxidoreductase [Paraconexibacter antarcticus]|uniref:NAD(P)/FAD-dependent oxidoreductase n=1 Tax=Paraconexibacter antarcticus TaxID=2949664 RepID=A0ABY5DPW8_9ACTN|nr:NAD(P)/FAD-dependent oxidoreductase [Paraconexibacter antarcticus]UTI63268.1 NAD(P)/FAD-dependent oxidoreductase [Paraconexibacter antarcticus]
MSPEPHHVDVLIVGAGLSGIGAARHLQAQSPAKSFAILEAREAIGGTWDLFRYPGIRSDSDMYTLGYDFKPWEAAKAIADGPSILEYVREAAREGGVERLIRFGHKVVRASWSTADARWTVEAVRTDTGETVRLTCGFLFSCSGYYRYDQGYTPQFPGADRFAGPIIHPQHWPEDLDYAGKRVVVIGSGATAVTLVPAMASDAAQVTMLQRSPSYMVAFPAEDPIANGLRKVLPAKAAYAISRWKNVLLTMGQYQLSRRRPALVKAGVRKLVKHQLPDGYPIDTHFKPSYDPWDQRPCLVPNGDLFKAISSGRASVVTDHIETFTQTGIRLVSGQELEADIIVTATGLDLIAFGGIELVVDERTVSLPEAVTYRGLMLSDVPNFAFVLGYTNASWTLKADLACGFACRLLNHMDAGGYAFCAPRYRESTSASEPFLDFASGYVQRALDRFPVQGSAAPWKLYQNYIRDLRILRRGELEDGSMEFTRVTSLPVEPPELAARVAA